MKARKRESHLLQMRGLKPVVDRVTGSGKLSHLLQMRGLKQTLAGFTEEEADVASFTDAWIETHSLRYLACGECRIFYRCVD